MLSYLPGRDVVIILHVPDGEGAEYLALADGGDVVLGRLVTVHTDQGDAPQGAVGVPVTATVQPVPVSPAGRYGRAQACSS
jgi:hypothetical protein